MWFATCSGAGLTARVSSDGCTIDVAVAAGSAALVHGCLATGWRAADAGRSAATGADGSASGRQRRERSEARR